jgi:hypothetical protein
MIENNKIYEIVFTKKDGSERRMHCTRNLDLIPQALRPKGTGRPSTSEERVFDLNKSEWRSFRRDSLISIREIEPVQVK